jgi:hypothetical protein
VRDAEKENMHERIADHSDTDQALSSHDLIWRPKDFEKVEHQSKHITAELPRSPYGRLPTAIWRSRALALGTRRKWTKSGVSGKMAVREA